MDINTPKQNNLRSESSVFTSLLNVIITVLTLFCVMSHAVTDWTFQVTWGNGSSTVFSYPASIYSDCLYDWSGKTLVCDYAYDYRDVTSKLFLYPERVTYISIGCQSQSYYDNRKKVCFCKDQISMLSSTSPSPDSNTLSSHSYSSSSSSSSSSSLPSNHSETTPDQKTSQSAAAQLSSVSSSLSSSTSTFISDYSFCQLYRLHGAMLQGLTSLEVIDLSDNLLSSVDPKTLSGLNSLKVLSLSFNPLSDLHKGLLCLPQNLRILDMRYSELKVLPMLFLSHCQENNSYAVNSSNNNNNNNNNKKQFSLEYLDVSYSTIRTIPQNAFTNYSHLQFLNISHNQISNLPSNPFVGASSLATVDISSNSIMKLPASFCQNNNFLQFIYLSNNVMSQINASVFENCHALRVLDLSRNSFAKIIDLPLPMPQLQKLSLTGNLITEVTQQLFRNASSLEVLDISHNNVKTINPSAFVGAIHLTSLLLHHNSLNESGVSLDGVLRHCTPLRHLDLSHNLLESVEIQSFSNIISLLETFNLSFNKIITVRPNALSWLTSLKMLSLSNNMINRLDPGMFQTLSSLTHLNLSGNILDNNSSRFNLPDSLINLDLSHNYYWNVPKFTNLAFITVSLSWNLLTSLASNDLSHMYDAVDLDFSHNLISHIDFQFFENFLSLRRLRLDHNKIPSVSDIGIADLDNLKYLDVGYNHITSITGFLFPESLETLILSNNALNSLENPFNFLNTPGMKMKYLVLNNCALTNIDQNVFENLDHLKHVDLRNNMIKTFSKFAGNPEALFFLDGNPVECSCGMAWLKSPVVVSGNATTMASNYVIDFCVVPPKNFSLPFHDVVRSNFLCEVHQSCPSSCTCYAQEMTMEPEFVMCNNRDLQSIPYNIIKDARVVALDGNELGELQAHFEDNLLWEELYLNSSRIFSIHDSFFDALSSLKVLDLSNNILDHLNQTWFQNMSNLSLIRAGNNTIEALPSSIFTDNLNLQIIDLSSNALQYFPDNLQLTFIQNLEKLKEVYLGGNPWKCDCQNSELIEWVKQQHHLFLTQPYESEISDPQNYPTSESGRRVADNNNLRSFRVILQDFRSLTCNNDQTNQLITFDLSDLDCDGSQYRMKITILIVCIIAFVIICLVSFCLYHRKIVTAILYSRFNIIAVKRPPALDQKIRLAGPFDITLIFDANDRKLQWWVDSVLIPKLHHPKWRFSVKSPSKEDIDQGMSHVDMNVHNIQRSRCSLLIVTSHFGLNQQCVSCFKQAIQQKRTGLHNVVVITWGELTRDTLDTGVRSFVSKGLDLPITAHLFWDRLFYQLPIPRHRRIPGLGSLYRRSKYPKDEDNMHLSVVNTSSLGSLSTRSN